MIKYRASISGNVTKEDVIKETKRFMCLLVDKEWHPDGRKEAKESDSHKYFDTFADAKEWAIKKLDERIAELQKSIFRAVELKRLAIHRTESDCDKYFG
mgnify:CR=1 FL=1